MRKARRLKISGICSAFSSLWAFSVCGSLICRRSDRTLTSLSFMVISCLFCAPQVTGAHVVIPPGQYFFNIFEVAMIWRLLLWDIFLVCTMTIKGLFSKKGPQRDPEIKFVFILWKYIFIIIIILLILHNIMIMT